MKNTLNLVLILLLALSGLYILNNIQSNIILNRCLFIPAVTNTGGVLTEFCIKAIKGSGNVYIKLPSNFEGKYLFSFLFAKDAVCKIYNNCNKYDYLFYPREYFKAEGFSGTAGFGVLIMSVFNKFMKDYAVTGFLLPNGIIFPVSGVNEKLEASLSNGERLVAPSNISKNIIQAYTILDLDEIFFNKKYNTSYSIPSAYIKVIRQIAYDICKNVSNKTIENFLNKGDYYTAASLCYIEKVKNSSFLPSNISESKLNKEIKYLEAKVEAVKCHTYVCKELKYQVMSRINLSIGMKDLNKKYWRFYTAKGWYKMLIALKNLNRKNTCKSVNRDFKTIEYLADYYSLNWSYENLNCFKKREILANIYINFLANFNFNISKFLNSTENYLFFLYKENGFSPTSYNYFEYGKDLIKMGKTLDGLLYILYGINYAI